jgi:hypothetical protein
MKWKAPSHRDDGKGPEPFLPFSSLPVSPGATRPGGHGAWGRSWHPGSASVLGLPWLLRASPSATLDEKHAPSTRSLMRCQQQRNARILAPARLPSGPGFRVRSAGPSQRLPTNHPPPREPSAPGSSVADVVGPPWDHRPSHGSEGRAGRGLECHLTDGLDRVRRNGDPPTRACQKGAPP